MAILNKLAAMRTLLGAIAVAYILGAALSGNALAEPEEQTEFTDFESIDADTFDIGAGDVTANFSGGFSATVGNTELYRSGLFAWMVNGGGTGQIEFTDSVGVVEFYARTDPTADGTSVLTAFDDQGVQVGDSVTLNPGDPFQLVSFTGPLQRIEFTNNASSALNAIDDFGFSPTSGSTLTIGTNQDSYSTGDNLILNIGASDPSAAADGTDELYVVVVFPDRTNLVYFTDLDATFANGSLSAVAEITPVGTSADFPVDLPEFFTFNWSGLEPVGNYTAFIVMIEAGSLADGSIDLGDIKSFQRADFSFNP